jgi:radical SAM protein with 4Fe4S-binding SPASM domain
VNYFLSEGAVLKRLETPSVYHLAKDELYVLDEGSFDFLKRCSSPSGCSSEKNEFIGYCLDEELLTPDPVSARRPPLVPSATPSLRYLELQITEQCNLRCNHCYAEHRGTSELSPEEVRKVLREFEEMQGLRVLITGGEPLLHSRFGEIIDMLPEFAVRKVLFTNGTMLEDRMLRRLPVDEIQISIDGLEQAHDALRGKGTFNAAMNAIVRAREAGFEVSVSTMVHPANLGDFDALEDLLAETGILDWSVDVPCITGALKRNVQYQLGPEQGGRFLSYGSGCGFHDTLPGYGCGLHLMSVTASGAVAKCTFYADRPAGRIEEGLRECRGRMKHIRLDEIECDCEHLGECRGGCRFRAELLGNPLGKDLYRCSLYLSESHHDACGG